MSVPAPRQDTNSAPPETAGRDTSKDGLANRLELWALTHGAGLWRAIQKGPLEGPFNRLLINSGIEKVEPRPYRLSTKAPYTSWDTLTDKSYNTRSLAAVSQDGLPDVKDVAKLFEREDEIPCEKSTVLFAYVAQWFTDGFLRSKRDEEDDSLRDITKNVSTHEVDLTQLYGMNNDITAMLRTPLQDGDGLLKSQLIGDEEFPPFLCENGEMKPEFTTVPGLQPLGFKNISAEQRDRLFAMGSDSSNAQIGYAMLNVLFLREHNRIARELAEMYAKSSAWPADPVARSERLFGTARNILTVLLIKVVIEEYINHIAPYHFRFKFDPNRFGKERWMRPNWVAVEFNLLYRWHSLIPSQLVIGDKPLKLRDTLFQMQLLIEHGLGQVFEDSSNQRAGRVGLRNTDPWLLEKTEVPSIAEGRKVGLDRFNAYRPYCKFPKVTSFDQITSDLEVRRGLRDLYDGDVNNLEFYVGLFAEDRRPNSVLPSMVGRLVGLHAFSQLMTNPLLAP
ncbi:MAG: heme peroxidase, partial [Actinomycetota bacterium]|nr:heme peroxidase [Actinomycetota bacterium]